MKLVIDTNIVFAALIKDSKTRELILSSKLQLFCIKEIIDEIANYRTQIIKRANISMTTFDSLLDEIIKQITLFPQTVIQPCTDEANSLLAHRDKKDVPFLALALCIKVDGIWSSDKDFDEQSKIKRISTSDLVELLKS